MRIRATRSRHFRAFAATIGPDEVAALARTVPSPETDELARILRSAATSDGTHNLIGTFGPEGLVSAGERWRHGA